MKIIWLERDKMAKMTKIMRSQFRDYLGQKASSWYFHETFENYMIGFGFERSYSDLNFKCNSESEKLALVALSNLKRLGEDDHSNKTNASLIREYGDNGFDSMIKAIKDGRCIHAYQERKKFAKIFIVNTHKALDIHNEAEIINLLGEQNMLPYEMSKNECIALLAKINGDK